MRENETQIRRRSIGPTTSRPVRQQSARSYRPLWSILALAGCLVLLGACLKGVFTVRRIEIVGRNVPRAAILRAADLSGRNIFRVRSDALVERLNAVPQIVVQRVATDLPGTVRIYARARIPMVAWESGGRLYLLDPEGKIIEPVLHTHLPIIAGASTDGRLDAGIVEAVRYAVTMLPSTPGEAIASFKYAPQTGLTIHGAAGWSADIGNGSPQTLVARIATLRAFLLKSKTHPGQLVFVDLRYRQPYAKYAGA